MVVDKKSEIFEEDNEVYIHSPFYSSFVKIMRIFLPLIALLIVIILVLKLSIKEQMPDISVSGATRNAEGEIEMIGVSYEGVDSERRPYRVDAKKASRTTDNPDKIDLEEPVATVKFSDGVHITARSDKGVYDRKQSIVNLIGNVELVHNQGYNLKMDDLLINMADGNAITHSKVSGDGPQGSIKSKGMTVAKRGNRIIFNGPAEILFYKDKGEQ